LSFADDFFDEVQGEAFCHQFLDDIKSFQSSCFEFVYMFADCGFGRFMYFIGKLIEDRFNQIHIQSFATKFLFDEVGNFSFSDDIALHICFNKFCIIDIIFGGEEIYGLVYFSFRISFFQQFDTQFVSCFGKAREVVHTVLHTRSFFGLSHGRKMKNEECVFYFRSLSKHWLMY